LVATKEAVRLAKEKGATLVILNVVEQDPAMYLEQVSEDVGLGGGTGVDGVLFAQQLASEAGIKTEIMVREGAVTGEIIRAADEARVSMIVMGSSNPRGLAGLYLGNVAEAVTKRAKVSVYIIKPTEEEIEAAMRLAKTPLPTPEESALRSIIHSRKFKVGLALFGIYGILYTIFTVLGTFGRDVMSTRIGSLNLGLVMGLTVIALAIIMALSFNYYAVKVEKEGR
jgi:nucleotide-binding universal stress UspA family protein/uncharacterized membrane protein (DUF485 family)